MERSDSSDSLCNLHKPEMLQKLKSQPYNIEKFIFQANLYLDVKPNDEKYTINKIIDLAVFKEKDEFIE